MFIPFFPPISWAIFFILYFYFLPERKPFLYIYVAAAVFYSILFSNLIINLGIFSINHKWLIALVTFTLWFSAVTWAFRRLTIKTVENTQAEDLCTLKKSYKPHRFIPSPAKKLSGKRSKR